MSSEDSKETRPSEPSGDDVTREDWYRYGLHREPLADGRDALGRPLVPADRGSRVGDETLVGSQRRQRAPRAGPARPARHSRLVANVLTVAAVVTIGAALAVYAIASSSLTPAPSPTPHRTPVRSAAASPSTSVNPDAYASPRSAAIAFRIDLPWNIVVADRDRAPDEGKRMYLTGLTGGVAVDPGNGKLETTFGGAAFSKAVRRTIVDSGLWVSTWPADATTCPASCWTAASTYRLDLASGSVTKTLPQTYLVGAEPAGIWVASGEALDRLDPSTGAVLSTTPWLGKGEPRVGCEALWSFTSGSEGTTLAEIDTATGGELSPTTLDPNVTFGPARVGGQCWMMTGSGGASAGGTTLVRLQPEAATAAVFTYPQDSIVILDGEFWRYASDRTIRRFDPRTGIGYGVPYVLPFRPLNNDPAWIFGAAGTVWLVDGKQLTGLDIPTGASHTEG